MIQLFLFCQWACPMMWMEPLFQAKYIQGRPCARDLREE